jgi:hypothetical protein
MAREPQGAGDRLGRLCRLLPLRRGSHGDDSLQYWANWGGNRDPTVPTLHQEVKGRRRHRQGWDDKVHPVAGPDRCSISSREILKRGLRTQLGVPKKSLAVLWIQIRIQDPDPHGSTTFWYPGSALNKNQDPDTHPDPHQSDQLVPEPDPHQFSDDKPKHM